MEELDGLAARDEDDEFVVLRKLNKNNEDSQSAHDGDSLLLINQLSTFQTKISKYFLVPAL